MMLSSDHRVPFSILGIGMIVFLCLAPTLAMAATVGPNSPTGAVDQGGFAIPWADPANVYSSNNQYAYWDNNNSCTASSNALRITGFNFDIPANATITGIEASFEGYGTEIDGYIFSAQLVWNSSTQGTAITWIEGTHGFFSTTDSVTTYGGSQNMWGAALTEAIVERSDFGVEIVVANFESCAHVYLDHVNITVHYTGPPTVTLSSGDISCTGDACPQNDGTCGFGWALANGTLDVDITFSQSVTGFTSGDITVTNGSVQSLAGSGDTYTATITSTCTNCLVQVSVGADVVTEGNGAAGPLYIPWGELYSEICDWTDMVIPAFRWFLDEITGVIAYTSVDEGTGYIPIPVHGTVRNATFDTNGMQCAATEDVSNLYSLYLDGTNDFIVAHAVGMRTIGLWVRSFTADPENQTIYHYDDGVNTLVISYDRTVPNHLSVVTQSQAVRSDTALVLTDWNHIIVRVSVEGVITDLLVNGTDVLASGTQSFVASDETRELALVGAKRIPFGYDNYFHGYVDDVFVPAGPISAATIWSIVGSQYVNDCTPPVESRFFITQVPDQNAAFTVTSWEDGINLRTTGKGAGHYLTFLKKNSVPIVRALTQLTQNRSWENVTADADPDTSKVVVYFPPAQFADHGHDPQNDRHTIYARKNNTASFRVCPEAVTLGEVSATCNGGVLFDGPSFPQTKSVGGVNVTVGTVVIDTVTYWYASGLTGSGGEGEGEESDPPEPIPFFPLWAYPVIIAAGAWFLKREGVWERV